MTTSGASRRDGGQSTVELALILPLLAVALLMTIQCGLLARDQIVATHAAREGARVAAVDADPAAVERAVGSAGSLDAGRLTVRVGARGRPGTRVRVEITYRSPVRIPLLRNLVDDVVFRTEATMRVER